MNGKQQLLSTEHLNLYELTYSRSLNHPHSLPSCQQLIKFYC